MLLSLERGLRVGVFVLFLARTVRVFRSGEERFVRPGSKNMCRWTFGFPRNLGDPVVSTEAIPGRENRVTNSRSVVRHAATTEDTNTAVCSRGIAERRKRSDAK